MKIFKDNQKIMRTVSKEVELPLSKENTKLAKEMIEWIDESQQEGSTKRAGVGIAAIQMGQLKRMFYINQGDFRDFLINPVIIGEGATGAALEGGEGCLSVEEEKRNDLEGFVHRKYKVIVKGYSFFTNKVVEYTKTGYHAIIIQHEMDHLNGKFFYDRIDQKNKWVQKNGEELI